MIQNRLAVKLVDFQIAVVDTLKAALFWGTPEDPYDAEYLTHIMSMDEQDSIEMAAIEAHRGHHWRAAACREQADYAWE